MSYTNNKRRVLLTGAALVWLSGCVTTRPTEAPVLNANQREAALLACERFELSGKIAVKQRTADGSDGGNGRFTWRQDFAEISFDLRAPLSNQTWRLQGVPGSYQLTDARGNTVHGGNAELLVKEVSGWTLPVSSLSLWVRGLSDQTSEPVRNPDGTLRQLKSDQWTVEYLSYRQSEPKLPERVKASHPDANLTLLIKRWDGCERK